jgi:hypothetical protein
VFASGDLESERGKWAVGVSWAGRGLARAAAAAGLYLRDTAGRS